MLKINLENSLLLYNFTGKKCSVSDYPLQIPPPPKKKIQNQKQNKTIPQNAQTTCIFLHKVTCTNFMIISLCLHPQLVFRRHDHSRLILKKLSIMKHLTDIY